MGINGYPVNFNPAQVQLFNPQTGQPSNQGLRFFLQLFGRTGSGSGLPSVGLNLVAAGNAQANALQLSNDWNEVDSGAGGVIFPQMQQGADIIVWNFSGNNLNCYPAIVSATPVQIDALGVNEPYILANNKMQWFRQTNYNQIRSMQLG